MPKGKGKKKQKEKTTDDGAGSGAVLMFSGPSQIVDDTDSICSSIPDSVLSDESFDDSADSSSDTELQFQVSEALDNLADKNSRTRMAALNYLNDKLKHKMVGQYIVGRTETLIDTLVRGIKRSQGGERKELLLLASLFPLQFGEDCADITSLLLSVLVPIIMDNSVSPPERSMAISTLTLCTFLLCHDMKLVEDIMHHCESLCSSCKIDLIVSAAIKGWSLLLSILPIHMIPAILTRQTPILTKVLESASDLSLKISSGQALSLLFELTRECNEDLLECEEAEVACAVVQSLASESNRYSGRKERTQQRASFRDFSQAIESGYVPERSIKFGSESLQLDSWARLIQYNVLTELLATGCRTHLMNNGLVRDIFQLGPPVLPYLETKATKIERKLINAASAKWRSQARGKQRDKRCVL
ncbi:PREDICTED: interferon-related developmental regulator 2-like isoform X2 [Amphimedon queenslandica]|uniref:Interferon-related developmental regulator N-terminal domain-containing protein n=1 Tax=Amphimedon queenslandica TaxID=400682 RepID=A0A1X7U563_AMPQE|nr:PREDICTED: interferon-related developmental regulator 2-like isoform X2 [Amphimedon queenslandica]|eukprot:XP_019856157.1 PREDICTED: interferon-related developmental regulator 2-like isoform X2 [Amphimedon queenslandica]